MGTPGNIFLQVSGGALSGKCMKISGHASKKSRLFIDSFSCGGHLARA